MGWLYEKKDTGTSKTSESTGGGWLYKKNPDVFSFDENEYQKKKIAGFEQKRRNAESAPQVQGITPTEQQVPDSEIPWWKKIFQEAPKVADKFLQEAKPDQPLSARNIIDPMNRSPLSRGVKKGLESFATSLPETVTKNVKAQAETDRLGKIPIFGQASEVLGAVSGISPRLKFLERVGYISIGTPKKIRDYNREKAVQVDDMVTQELENYRQHRSINPDQADSQIGYALGSGIGSLGLAAGVTATTKNPGMAGGIFGAIQKGQTYGEARKAGLSAEKASSLGTAAGITEGALEYLGLEALTKNINIANPAVNFVVSRAVNAVTEGSQEFAQEVGSNAWAKLGYDNERSLMQGAAEAALIGGILGAPFGAVLGNTQNLSKTINIREKLESVAKGAGLQGNDAQAYVNTIIQKLDADPAYDGVDFNKEQNVAGVSFTRQVADQIAAETAQRSGREALAGTEASNALFGTITQKANIQASDSIETVAKKVKSAFKSQELSAYDKKDVETAVNNWLESYQKIENDIDQNTAKKEYKETFSKEEQALIDNSKPVKLSPEEVTSSNPSDKTVVADYVERINNGETLAPVIIDKNNVVVDGNNRLAAYKQLGIKEFPVARQAETQAKTETKDPLVEEAKKYKSAEEFVNFMRGSATQYSEYNPKLRATVGMFEDSKRLSELGVDPEQEVTIYRGIADDSVKNPKINDGDFVVTDLESAKSYAGENVVSKKVKAKDLVAEESEFDANDPFYIGAEFVYSDSKNKITNYNKDQLTEIYNKAQKEKKLAEFDKEAKQIREEIGVEKGKVKIAKSVQQKAIEKRLTKGFEDVAEYNKITIEDQSRRAAEVMQDIENARAMIRGEKELPSGLKEASLIIAAEEYIAETGDVSFAEELANSPLTVATSEAAQQLRIAAERDPDSATAKLSELKEARQKVFEERSKKTLKQAKKEEVANLKEKVKKSKPTKETWNSFIDSIQC